MWDGSFFPIVKHLEDIFFVEAQAIENFFFDQGFQSYDSVIDNENILLEFDASEIKSRAYDEPLTVSNSETVGTVFVTIGGNTFSYPDKTYSTYKAIKDVTDVRGRTRLYNELLRITPLH